MRTKNPTHIRIFKVGAVVASIAMLMTACASAEQAKGKQSGGDAEYYKAAVAEAKAIADGKDLNKSLEMVGLNSGGDGQALQELYKAFTEGTGVSVKYTGAPDVNNIVQSRLQAGNPPDVADLSLGIGLSYAKDGDTIDLSDAFGDELSENFSEEALENTSVDGKVFGIYQGFNNFMLWYNPETYSGPESPTSWEQIKDWTTEQADEGNPVWCAAQNAGAQSGFPGAQFLENIFLKKYGPELYREWGEGGLPWTSPEVKDAFEEFGAMIGTDDNVAGGVSGILSTQIATGYNGLTSDPASCQAILWGAWVPGYLGDTVRPGENLDFYRVPATNEEFADYELFQSSASVGFTDNDTTKAFLQFISSTPAQTYLASLGRWPVANKNVASDAYPTTILKKISEEYFGSSGTKPAIGPNALADPETQNAYWKGVVTYLQNPSQLDDVLKTIQAASEE